MDVTVVTSGHDVADARLHRLVSAMVRSGLEVEVLGLGSSHDGPAGAATTARRRPGMVGRSVLALRYAFRARGRVLLALDPDSAVAAYLAARARGRRVAVDVHEDYGALLADRGWAHGLLGWGATRVVGAADAVAARADLTLVADEHVPPASARNRLVVRNEPDRAMLPAADEFVPADEPRAAYVGDVRSSRGLRAMVEAARLARRWTLDLVGPVAGDDEQWLQAQLAADPDLAARVRLHGRRPPAESWQLARHAWVGLCLLEDTPAFHAAMPSKVLEFIACGVPVVTTNLPRPAELVGATGAGAVVPCGTPPEVGGAVAALLDDLAEDPGRLSRWRTAARHAAQSPNPTGSPYDRAAEALTDLVGIGRPRRNAP